MRILQKPARRGERKTRCRRKKHGAKYVGNREWPTVLKLVRDTCELCSRESSYCCLCRMFKSRQSDAYFRKPLMMCATCRVGHALMWSVAPNWQTDCPIPTEGKTESKRAFAEWAAQNPPYTDEQLAELA